MSYEGFSKLYNRYHNQSFTILQFPSNQFGSQEPKANKDIEKFVQGASETN
jgi:glutathione peroxidase